MSRGGAEVPPKDSKPAQRPQDPKRRGVVGSPFEFRLGPDILEETP